MHTYMIYFLSQWQYLIFCDAVHGMILRPKAKGETVELAAADACHRSMGLWAMNSIAM